MKQIYLIAGRLKITKKDITASFKIKNANILDRCNDIIKEYRNRLSELSLEFNDIDIDTIVSYIRQKKENKGVSFTDFAAKWIEGSTIKGIKNYKTALNALCSFVGRDNILCEEINVKTMKAFEDALKDRPRAQSLYPNCIKAIFNAAKEYYNDEDNDIILTRKRLSDLVFAIQTSAKLNQQIQFKQIAIIAYHVLAVILFGFITPIFFDIPLPAILPCITSIYVVRFLLNYHK